VAVSEKTLTLEAPDAQIQEVPRGLVTKARLLLAFGQAKHGRK